MSEEKYQICEMLEMDSYGPVYKVMNKSDNSFSLMKSLPKKLLKNHNESFVLKQMEQLTSLNHINLSKYKDYFFNENNFNIVMEYDDESELKSKLEYNKSNKLYFEENYLWSLIIQLLDVLKFFKNNKNIQFELDTANILLMNNGKLKVYNYGFN